MKPGEITKIIGYILLSPALISVILFILQLLFKLNSLKNMEIGNSWTGYAEANVSPVANEWSYGFGYTSALPFYFGLMAIAGAYLIKDKK